MANVTSRIRNLSIALEALSRLNRPSVEDRVYALLQSEISKAEEEAYPTPVPARSAYVTTDDDIPF